MEQQPRKISIVKKIAKHGNQAVIVVPKSLREELCPGTIVELNIEVLRKSDSWI